MLSERTKALLRILFEKELYNFFGDTFYKDGLEKAMYLLKESPVILSEFAKKYEKEFERVLLSEQEGNGD